jgi:predicted molibdopterin-dependent oxidoreductase YjgC
MEKELAHYFECARAAYSILIERAQSEGKRMTVIELRREWQAHCAHLESCLKQTEDLRLIAIEGQRLADDEISQLQAIIQQAIDFLDEGNSVKAKTVLEYARRSSSLPPSEPSTRE